MCRAPIFNGMKRFVIFFLIAFGSAQFPALAQNAEAASAIADKQDAEERYKRMSADVESMMAANVALQKKVSALENELQKVREEQSELRSANKNDGTTDSLKKLAEKIQEVDKKRESDKELILAEFAKLGKTLAAAPTQRTSSKPVITESTGPEKGFPHTVESGETLGKIVSDYNAAFKSKGMKTVTQKQVMDANPNVNWNRLKIGQKIFVPAPPEK
jgi:LysM repeat protein